MKIMSLVRIHFHFHLGINNNNCWKDFPGPPRSEIRDCEIRSLFTQGGLD